MADAGLQHVSVQQFLYAWTYSREKPETQHIAGVPQSPRQMDVRNALLDKLLGGKGRYPQHQIEELKCENYVSHKHAEEGVHGTYPVACGQKTSC